MAMAMVTEGLAIYGWMGGWVDGWIKKHVKGGNKHAVPCGYIICPKYH
jgi:hypothetical protein